MNKLKCAWRAASNSARRSWRPFLLGLLISLLLAACALGLLIESERAERAAFAIGGTLIGMICLALLICGK